MIIPTASTSKEDPMDPPPPYTRADHMRGWDDNPDSKAENSKGNRNLALFESTGTGLQSSANIAEDGRINISMNLTKALPDLPPHYTNPVSEFAVDPTLALSGGKVPRMSIVIMIVGSRGDVQPFLALGQELLRQGHRVRIATHGTFRAFVKDAGPEFFDIGGDPHELMSYMVKNPGLMPGWASLTNGDIPRKQKMLSEILEGCWDACTQPDIDYKPFVADAIISNPPAFAHVHCAEALGIPLQLSFTMPWSPTTAFPHPLVNVSHSNAEPGLTNYLTYGLTEMMTWQGLGGVINEFRRGKLGLEPLNVRSGPGLVDRLKVPWTYCFSPELVPKPSDWQNHIDVTGFYFLDLATNYTPKDDLAAFLAAGPPPIYIGFGSVVVEDPVEMTRVIFEATERAGVRALVSAGWGGLGNSEIPPHVFILGNVPHDWLFTKVFAVCHHGGAGTTAIGLRLGKPTIVVPFFGDQPFWGSMIHKSGAGPKPIKTHRMDVERLAISIEYCKTREAREAAERLGEQIRAQNGVQNGVESFYRHLPILNMRCDLVPDELAVWWSSEHCLKLSAVAAHVLNQEKLLNIHKLEIHRSKEYDIRVVATDFLSGGVVEALRMLTAFPAGLTDIILHPKQGIINTTTAVPRGILHILDSFAEGFSNTPALYGSQIREPGTTKGFRSGLKEGGKAFFFGLSDGITGLWTEPADGFKAKGLKGLVEGSVRSYANALMLPAGGALRLVTYPLRGALMSLYRNDTTMERHLRQLRVDQGKDALVQPRPEELATTPDESLDQDTTRGKGKKSTSRASFVRRRDESFDKHLRGLHITSPDNAALYDSEARAKIVEQFREACQKENVTKRKKAMHKRIQWVITRGGAGSLVQRPENRQVQRPEDREVHRPEPKEVQDSHGRSKRVLGKTRDARVKEQDGQARSNRRLRRGHGNLNYKYSAAVPEPTSPSGSLSPPPSQSYGSSYGSPDSMQPPTGEWTEEDEALFTHQIHAARQLSLQSSKGSESFPPEVKGGNVSYEEALLAAAAEWSQETYSPAIEGSFGLEENTGQYNLEKDLPAVHQGHP